MEQIFVYLISGISFLMLCFLFLIYRRLGYITNSKVKIVGDYVVKTEDDNPHGSIELTVYNQGNKEVEIDAIGLCCNGRYINVGTTNGLRIKSHCSYQQRIAFTDFMEIMEDATFETTNLHVRIFAIDSAGHIRYSKGRHLVRIIEHYRYHKKVQAVKPIAIVENQDIPQPSPVNEPNEFIDQPMINPLESIEGAI